MMFRCTFWLCILASVCNVCNTYVQQQRPIRNMRTRGYLKMSSCDYLNSLQTECKDFHMKKHISDGLYDKLQQASDVQNDIEVDTIVFNVYKLRNIFFNRNSKNIIFELKDNMDKVYYYENDTVFKIPKETKITSKALRNFYVTQFNNTSDIDAIMYKE